MRLAWSGVTKNRTSCDFTVSFGMASILAVRAMTQQRGISGTGCEACDLVALTFTRDAILIRGVKGDPRLRPAALRRYILRQMVGKPHLRGRGVGPRAAERLDAWLSKNQGSVPGLRLRESAHHPRQRLAAVDARFLIGDAQWALEHLLAAPNARQHAAGRPQWLRGLATAADTIRRRPPAKWKALTRGAALRAVAIALGVSSRTIDRRLKSDPRFHEPSCFAWAAVYHRHSLQPPVPIGEGASRIARVGLGANWLHSALPTNWFDLPWPPAVPRYGRLK